MVGGVVLAFFVIGNKKVVDIHLGKNPSYLVLRENTMNIIKKNISIR